MHKITPTKHAQLSSGIEIQFWVKHSSIFFSLNVRTLWCHCIDVQAGLSLP